jgi:hypothetical protein
LADASNENAQDDEMDMLSILIVKKLYCNRDNLFGENTKMMSTGVPTTDSITLDNQPFMDTDALVACPTTSDKDLTTLLGADHKRYGNITSIKCEPIATNRSQIIRINFDPTSVNPMEFTEEKGGL